MRVGTDDEVYRVDAVWLGPPRATFPFRARYIAWGVGIAVWLAVFASMRGLGFGIGFFPLAWSLVITIALTRLICSKINHERPLGGVLMLLRGELQAPRDVERTRGSALDARRVRISAHRPRPRSARNSAALMGQHSTVISGDARRG